MNRNKYIYNFWMTGFYFALSAVHLYMGMLAITICQGRSQLQKNKEIILHLTKKKRNFFKKKARSCWVKQGSSSQWWMQFEKNKVNESSWKENFRFSRYSFYELCRKLNPYFVKKRTLMRIPKSVESQVGAFLYYISNEGQYQETANAFII